MWIEISTQVGQISSTVLISPLSLFEQTSVKISTGCGDHGGETLGLGGPLGETLGLRGDHLP
jgi:hypothetical protein